MKSAGHQKIVIAFIALVVLSLACSSQFTVYETPVPPNVETVVAATIDVYTKLAPKVISTYPPTITPVPPTPTAEELGDVYVYTIVDNVNLRTKPGMLFPVSRVMPKDTKLQLLGQAPGAEWLYVRNDEDVEGWVNVNIVLMAYDGPPPPVIEPEDVLLVTGNVVTELGTHVSGIGFAVVQGARSANASTDDTGQFYAYLPRTMSGVWTVSHVSVSCKSNTMNASCNCINGICGTAYPANATVQLPQSEPLHFVWK